MPIYEFKCLKCNNFFECLSLKRDDKVKTVCPECHSEDFERIISSTNYSMGNGVPKTDGQSSSAQTRTCSGGSCATYNLGLAQK